jgi:hypothetical protein
MRMVLSADAHLLTMPAKGLLAEACARLAGLTKLTRDEMRLAGYPDDRPEIDVCVGKEIVVSLVERGGSVRSHHVPTVTPKTLRPILQGQIDAASRVMSDDDGARVGREFPRHQSVNHSIGEYVRGDVHTNTIEGYFSIFKRGINGVYHHVSRQHLKRYFAEFDFRYSEWVALGVDDELRADKLVRSIVGKRLTYRNSSVGRA